MNARVLVNGADDATLSPLDRGLLYGDGLFETVRLVQGRAPLWVRHMARLQQGCGRLQLPLPDAECLWQETARVATGLESAVVRITLTRGIGERGYAMPIHSRPTRMLQAWPASPLPVNVYDHGVRVRFCATRLALQPALAGIKHLNRLQQVLARAEWSDANIAEGVMFDTCGRVICATAANLFMVLGGRLCTPALNDCGVAGVARAEVLAHCSDAIVAEFTREDLMRAEEIFLTSSVRGIVPVRSLADHTLEVGAQARRWQVHWRALGLFAGTGL